MIYKEKLLAKLKHAYITYGKIVIGVDFDDTIFPYSDQSIDAHQACREVRSLVDSTRQYATICLWTVSNEWSMIYKKFICEEHFGMSFDHYNESPIFSGEDVRKPHFNLLLDDCSGLGESVEVLKEFMAWVQVVGDENNIEDE